MRRHCHTIWKKFEFKSVLLKFSFFNIRLLDVGGSPFIVVMIGSMGFALGLWNNILNKLSWFYSTYVVVVVMLIEYCFCPNPVATSRKELREEVGEWAENYEMRWNTVINTKIRKGRSLIRRVWIWRLIRSSPKLMNVNFPEISITYSNFGSIAQIFMKTQN